MAHEVVFLMRDQTRCPSCGRHTVRWDNRRCSNPNCKTWLFKAEDSFNRIQEDLILSYYLWHPTWGWYHSSHLQNPEPNDPVISNTPPPRDYGMGALPKGCSAGPLDRKN